MSERKSSLGKFENPSRYESLSRYFSKITLSKYSGFDGVSMYEDSPQARHAFWKISWILSFANSFQIFKKKKCY